MFSNGCVMFIIQREYCQLLHKESWCFNIIIICSLYNFIYFVTLCFLLRAISFATFVVMIVPYRRYNIKLFEICSTESLKIYIFHVFLLQFYVLQNPIIYFAMVVVGTIMLLVIYNLIERCIALI
jgi:hypothetical protein